MTLTQSPQAEIENQLRAARLPSDPKRVVSRVYCFTCIHGSHHHVLIGTIVAIELSDEGGLDLHVTSPRIWGETLISFKYEGNGWWFANQKLSPVEDRLLYGSLELL